MNDEMTACLYARLMLKGSIKHYVLRCCDCAFSNYNDWKSRCDDSFLESSGNDCALMGIIAGFGYCD